MAEPSTRRIAMEKARQSRRPSRHGRQAGTSSPNRILDNAGMPDLLKNVLARARRVQDLDQTLEVLLSLDGHVPVDVSLRALTGTELAGLTARFKRPGRAGGRSVFTGALGLARTGKVVIGVPGQCQPNNQWELVGVAAQVPWTRKDVQAFELALETEHSKHRFEVAACREWLGEKKNVELVEILTKLRSALLHTAPFLLYRGTRIYTNFREENNLTGKSLLPDHPRCVLYGLEGIPLKEWSDDQAVLVTCLFLLSGSGGNHRIEECNGMQFGLRRVAELFNEKYRLYLETGPGRFAGVPLESRPADLQVFADQLREARSELSKTHLLYRRISGPVLNKRECIVKLSTGVTYRESAVLAWLRDNLPVQAKSYDEMVAELRRDSAWLNSPHGDFETGLEDLIYQVVVACTQCFPAHFALSRGFRSLPMLVEAMRRLEWARICSWELPEFFCCVVPSPSALNFFDGSWEMLVDAAWAMSARMQFNSWHFLAGNLPAISTRARDYFTPPEMPDISNFSDQHHRGHVYNRVRFTIRSPQPVKVDGQQFNGLVDIRLVRCDGDSFEEQDMLDAHRISRLLAAATESVAERVVQGESVELRAFDHVWHRNWVRCHLR